LTFINDIVKLLAILIFNGSKNMFCYKKVNVALTVAISVMALTACHPKAQPVSLMDRELSCAALRHEIQQVKDMQVQIDRKTGFSGRNVGMALLFWPGIVINEVTASDAESLANHRLAGLQNIYAEKKCSLDKKDDVAVNEKNEQAETKKG